MQTITALDGLPLNKLYSHSKYSNRANKVGIIMETSQYQLNYTINGTTHSHTIRKLVNPTITFAEIINDLINLLKAADNLTDASITPNGCQISLNMVNISLDSI